jgi:septum formation protein
MTTPRPLILASKSPRRQKLLAELGFSFTVEEKNVDESVPFEMPAKDVPTYLAEKKAQPFEERSDSHLIIAADTIVLLDDEILGKPHSRDEAIRMLNKLSGRQHSVITGVTLLMDKKYHTFREVTLVYFKSLSYNDIIFYVDHYQPYDKAGAYGIQEWIGFIGISRIEGDFYNVMGLPVCRLVQELGQILDKS